MSIGALYIQHRSTIVQLIKYGGLGLAVNGLGYLVYLLATYLGVPPKSAMSGIYFLMVVIGFFGNRALVFNHNGKMSKAAFRFFAAHLLGYLVNFSLLWIGSDIMGIPHEYVQAAAIFIVAVLLFILFRVFVFPSPAPSG